MKRFKYRWILGLSVAASLLIGSTPWLQALQLRPDVQPKVHSSLQIEKTSEKENLPDMVEKVSPSVVNISSTTVFNYQVFGMDEYLRLWGIPQERKQTSLGSGFIIDGDDGYILTNNHVVEKASEVIVTLSDKRQFRAKIIGKDDKMDLALLQIRDQNKVPVNIKPVPFGNSDIVRIAETVVAVGNPFGLQNTVTKGIISAKNRTIGLGPFDNFLQTDASINPGNSGGPLFNTKGEVIGINTAIHSKIGQSNGLGFAIPSNAAKKVVPDLIRYGRVPRPWLGIMAERMSPQLQEYYDLPTAKGVLVYRTIPRAPADRAGLRQGDIITEVDGVSVAEIDEVERVLANYKPIDQVKIKLHRGDRIQTLTIKLEELPKLENLPREII